MDQIFNYFIKLSIWDKELNNIPMYHKKQVINTINAYSFLLFEKDILFRNSLIDSDIVLPDGHGITLAAKLLMKKKIVKIAGADIFHYILEKAQTNNSRIFFLGSSILTLNKIQIRLEGEYPNIIASYLSPPFKDKFSESENNAIVEEINKFAPDILFVGMSAPKQEKWVHDNKGKINAKVICSIGAVFDFYAQTVNRPPVWMCRYGLEWFGRLLNEPKRLWKRYLIGNTIFLYKIFLLKLKIMFEYESAHKQV